MPRSSRPSRLWRIRHGDIAPMLLLLVACFALVGLPALHLLVHEREAALESVPPSSWRYSTGPALLPVGQVGLAVADQTAGPDHHHGPGIADHADADAHATPASVPHTGPRHHRHGTGKGSGAHGQGALEHLGCALLGVPAIEFVVLVAPLEAAPLVYRTGQVSPRFKARANITRGPPRGDSPLSPRTTLFV